MNNPNEKWPSNSGSPPNNNSTNRHGVSRASSADSIFDDISTQAHHIFANLDEERKGYLDMNMLARSCEKGFNDKQLGELIQQLDHDGDGKVSMEDFKQCLKQIARRNSAIRASIQMFPRPSVARDRNMSTTPPEWTRSRLPSDASMNDDHSTYAVNRITGTCRYIGSREKDRERLLHRIASSNSRTPTLQRQGSTSLPELGLADEYLSTLNCQEYIYELYHLLSAENPTLTRMYEFVLADFVQYMRQCTNNQKRLEGQIESERCQHRADLVRLSEELDQQVQLAEEAARLREREIVMAENRSQLEAKSQRIDQLMERLRQMEEHQTQPESTNNTTLVLENKVEELQMDLSQLRQEKSRLEEALTSTRSSLAHTKTELTAVRQKLIEKSREFDGHLSAFLEVVKENSSLKRRLCLLQEVNRDLCDANDGLCTVLEKNTQSIEEQSKLREASAASSLMLNGLPSENHLPIAEERVIGEDSSPKTGEASVQSNDPDNLLLQSIVRRHKASLIALTTLPKDIGEERSIDRSNACLDSLHEDSGMSSLRDAPEMESEFEVDNPAYPGPHQRGQSYGSLRPTSEERMTTSSNVSQIHGSGLMPKGEDKLRIFRVMLAGDSAVGKTSLLLRLCDNIFTGKTVSTIGIDMKTRSIVVDGRATMLQVWDTAGQERFRSISANFYRKADGILLVYDCTAEQSFLNIRDWMTTIHECAGREIPVAILANKVDLRTGENGGSGQVSSTAGRKFAQETGALYFETSAATGENVYESAAELARLLCAQEDYNLRRPQLKLSPRYSLSRTGGGCCKT